MQLTFFIFPVLGLLSGFLAGLLGIGGGLIIVPGLLLIFTYQGFAAASITHSAIATSLATVLVTSLVATYSHHRHGAVDWLIFRKMAPGLVSGAVIGAIAATYLAGETLRAGFGIFVLLAAAQMGLQLQPAFHGRLPATAGLTLAGGIIGVISALVGIGGGTMTVPFLRWAKVTMQRAVATSSACGFPIAVGASLGFSLTGTTDSGDTIYWPAAAGIAFASLIAVPLGTYFTHRLPTLLLTRLFALILVLIGLRLVFV